MSEADAAEPTCTAFASTTTNERNALYTPPCACPQCAPAAMTDDTRPTIWLAINGRSVRFEVAALELGCTGRDLLG